MAQLIRFTLRGACGARNGIFPSPWVRAVCTSSPNMALKASNSEDFWAKNQRLRRPISPHLTIYRPQITSMLSLGHRATGIVLSSIISGFSIGMLALPGSFPHYLDAVQGMHFGGAVIFGAKFLIALPFAFHICNGVRHLVWDLGFGFSLRTLYKTGYAVLSLSVALAALAAAL